MRLLIAAIAVFVLGVLCLSSYGAGPSQKMTQGELRCEGPGAVIIKVDGKDYAVNGMAVRVTLQLRAFGPAPRTQKQT